MGKVMPMRQIRYALGILPPNVQSQVEAVEAHMQSAGTPLDKAARRVIVEHLMGGPPPDLDYRTLVVGKMAVDKVLYPRGEAPNPKQIGSLATIDRNHLLKMQSALTETLKAATIQPDGSSLYGTALNTHAGGHVEQEAFERGLKAAATPIMTEYLLQDPKLLAQGKAAVEQARLGVAMGLYNQLDESGKLASETNPWTPPRQAIMRLVAPPELQPKLDDFFTTMEKKAKAFELVRDLEPRIQTRQTETSGGQVAAATAQAMTGRGIGWRLGNFVQGRLSRMNPKTARDIIRAYYFMDPNDVLTAIRGQAYQPSQVPGRAGFGVGVGVNQLLGPPPQP